CLREAVVTYRDVCIVARGRAGGNGKRLATLRRSVRLAPGRAGAVGVGLRADAGVVLRDGVPLPAAALLLLDRVARGVGPAHLPDGHGPGEPRTPGRGGDQDG